MQLERSNLFSVKQKYISISFSAVYINLIFFSYAVASPLSHCDTEVTLPHSPRRKNGRKIASPHGQRHRKRPRSMVDL